MNSVEDTNMAAREVIKYIPPDSIMIDLHFILTQNRTLTRNMPYLLLEKRVSGNYIAAVRLLDFHEKDGVVSLMVQELESKRKYTLSANINYHGNMWIWSLGDFYTLTEIHR